jgi:hypothetical protein
MIIGVQGSRNFSDYQIYLRAMGTALSMIDDSDREIIIYSAGPANINSMAMEFNNITERSIKARGLKIKTQKIPIGWLKGNYEVLDYFVYLSKPKENLSDLANFLDRKGVEMGVYRY